MHGLVQTDLMGVCADHGARFIPVKSDFDVLGNGLVHSDPTFIGVGKVGLPKSKVCITQPTRRIIIYSHTWLRKEKGKRGTWKMSKETFCRGESERMNGGKAGLI